MTSCTSSSSDTPAAWNGLSHENSSAITTTCGSAITAAGHARRTLHAKLHGKRAHAHARVALDGLEVVERHDAMGARRIEQRQR